MQENLLISLPDGRQLGYAEYGDPAGYPILYFPGFPCCRLEARKFHKVAISNSLRIISIDRPGLGISTFQKKRSILSWPTDVLSLTANLGVEKFSIFGHSAGSAFASACAYAIPEKLNSVAIVSGLAPLNLPEARTTISSEQKFVSKIVALLPFLAPVLMWTMYRKIRSSKEMAQMVGLPEVDANVLEDSIYKTEFKEMLRESFRNGIAGPAREMQLVCNSWGFDIREIKIPITIWHGRLDTIAPVCHAGILARLIPGSRLNIIENEGHISIFMKAAAEKILNGLRDFKV